ncbi:hypothetical protein B0H15DRAFT_945969 [Mycena belliarum]|uniref:Uncharacterized protein n=1 Tax=Mycena belliarum TaxID=1033014 RepID=A0AAD6UAU8_9AGAR|nr:hypothetical protein B0H15DRAFT_945969 [Mycena belliae]
MDGASATTWDYTGVPTLSVYSCLSHSGSHLLNAQPSPRKPRPSSEYPISNALPLSDNIELAGAQRLETPSISMRLTLGVLPAGHDAAQSIAAKASSSLCSQLELPLPQLLDRAPRMRFSDVLLLDPTSARERQSPFRRIEHLPCLRPHHLYPRYPGGSTSARIASLLRRAVLAWSLLVTDTPIKFLHNVSSSPSRLSLREQQAAHHEPVPRHLRWRCFTFSQRRPVDLVLLW